jgi:hypothetical protein
MIRGNITANPIIMPFKGCAELLSNTLLSLSPNVSISEYSTTNKSVNTARPYMLRRCENGMANITKTIINVR